MSEVIVGAPWRDYLEMCKPRVVLLMLICSVAGMFLATSSVVPLDVLIYGNIGIALVAGSAAVVNHIADAHIDSRMARTQSRPVATGRVSNRDAIIFSEKLSHSTVPWASTGRERRSVFYKFVPYGQHHADKRYNWLEPTLTTEESERLALPAWWFNTEADKQPCEPYPRM